MGSAPLGHLRPRGVGGQENLLSIMLAANSNLAMFNPLNASAIYLGQGAGAAIGAFVLLYGSLGSLG
jgi:predicted MFS family arabinose efflux permease